MPLQVTRACELSPGEMHLLEAAQAEAGALQALANLERLPEVLHQALKAKLAEGEIVTGVIVVMGRVLAGAVERLAQRQGAVHEEHGHVMDGVHGREDAKEMPARFQAGVDFAKAA